MSKIQTSGSTVETMQATSFSETLLNILPDNPFKALANGEMLQVIVFALIIGVILAKLGERAETVANFFSQFNDIMMEMTMMVMSLAPIGVFCLISRTFATIGFSAFLPLAKYMIAVLIALAVQCFGVYQILLKIFTGLNPLKFIKKFFPVMAFAFSTATSNATIPLSMMMIGISIAKADLRSYLKDVRMYLFILLRMVALPIIIALLMRDMGFDPVVFGVFIIELAMPVGSIIGLFAKECGADDAYCMKGAVLSTLASIFTIPIVGLFL